MNLLSHIPSLLKNKYLLATTGFFIWMMFFDNDNFFVQAERGRELREKQKGVKYYQEQIAIERSFSNGIRTDMATLEKYARERYMMKKDNEDLYLIRKPEKD